jgi:hypothetical protein
MRVPLLACLLAAAFAASLFGATAENWTIASSHLAGVTGLSSITYGNGHFVATTTSQTAGSTLAWSRDGVAWRFASTSVPYAVQVVFSAGHFTVLTIDGVWRSSDGLIWDHVQTFSLTPSNRFRFDLIRAGYETFLIANSDPNGTLLYSPDGATLQETSPLPHLGSGTLQINGIVSLDRFFYVAYTVTQGGTSTPHFVFSSDGFTWNDVPWFDGLINSGEMDNGPDLAVAIFAGTVTSFSARGFGNQVEVPRLAYDKVFYAGYRFFASSTLEASTDGVTWAPLAALSRPPGAGVVGVAYGNGRYVAVGSAPQTDLVAYLDYPGPPTIAVPPFAQTVVEGRPATFTVGVDQPDASTAYQWLYDGNAIPGATTDTLRLASVTRFDRGDYSVQVNTSRGFVRTYPVDLTVVPVTQAGRIINLSVLTPLTDVNDTLTMGFVLGGEHATGTKPLLVRAGGPSLSRFSVSNPNPDPNLELYAESTKVAANDNWGGGKALSDLFDQAGAFPFVATNSTDAAYAAPSVPLGKNSVWVRGTGGALGPLIAEVYDYSSASSLTIATPRLINVSVLKPLGAGGRVTAGFYIDGSTSVKVLVRAIGPSLSQFVTNAAPDPQLALFHTDPSTPLLTNDDWGGGADLSAAFAAVNAFGLEPTSKDAAIVTTLAPGGYSAQATTTAAGTVLVEVYEIP